MEVEDIVRQQRNVGDGRVLMMLAIGIVIVRAVVRHLVARVVPMGGFSSPCVRMLDPRRHDSPCQHQCGEKKT